MPEHRWEVRARYIAVTTASEEPSEENFRREYSSRPTPRFPISSPRVHAAKEKLKRNDQPGPARRHDPNDPLIPNGSEIVSSVTHAFSNVQHLYLYYEVYDPTRSVNARLQLQRDGTERLTNTHVDVKNGVRLLSNVSFFKGDVKASETSLIEVQEISVSPVAPRAEGQRRAG